METQAYAKINLTLDIVGRDSRGYHLLSSVFARVSLADTVSLKSGGQGLTLICSDPNIPTDERNLCVKAANAFLAEFAFEERDFQIDLVKKIPSCAGLGGGSSDAAAVLRLLCEHFGISPQEKRVHAVALSVGADVPFFLQGGVCLAEGVGERLTPLQPLPEYTVLLAKANEGASTPEVYRLFDELTVSQLPATAQFLTALRNDSDIIPHLSNHLTAATAKLCPSVVRLKENLLRAGALGAEMSGSGTAVYGLFASEKEAKNAVKIIDAEFCEICRFI